MKNERLKERIDDLLNSQQPDQQIKAFQVLAKRLEGILDIVRDAGSLDDPIFRVEKERLQALINEAAKILK